MNNLSHHSLQNRFVCFSPVPRVHPRQRSGRQGVMEVCSVAALSPHLPGAAPAREPCDNCDLERASKGLSGAAMLPLLSTLGMHPPPAPKAVTTARILQP